MRFSKVLLIVNPASRRGARVRAKAERAFAEAGVTLVVMETEAPGHGAQIAAREAAELRCSVHARW